MINAWLIEVVLHSYEHVAKRLICVVVERLYPETKTFHMPFGEMTITLDDVSQILGIPIEGRSITGILGGPKNMGYQDS